MSALSPTRPRILWPLAGLIVSLAVVAGLLNPLSAHATPVALSGVVHTDSGAITAKTSVTAVSVVGTTFTDVATTTTTASGTFAFPNLAAGTYTLRFPRTASSFAQFLGGTPSPTEAQLLTLTDAGSNESSVAVALAASGTLAGTVKTATGTALAKYSVDALAKNDAGSWIPVATATTTSKGAYSLTGLEPGRYILRARGAATAAVYSGNVTSLDSATHRGVLANKTTTTALVTGATGNATGVVLGFSATKLAGVEVSAYRLTSSGGVFTSAERIGVVAMTNSQGSYTLKGLPAGTYTLRFEAPSNSPYASSFLGGSNGPLQGSIFIISAGATAIGLDQQLMAAATISGTVTTAAPVVALSKIALELHYANSTPGDGHEPIARTVTDPAGQYTFSGLAAGNYVVYAGSHSDSIDGGGITENTSRARLAIPVSNLTQTESRIVPISLSLKDASGLHPNAGSLPTVFAPLGYQVGRTIAVSPGTWNATSTPALTYRWYRDGRPITDAIGMSHTLTPGDAGTMLTVRVTARDFAQGTGVFTSAKTPVIQVAAAPVVSGVAPSVTGQPVVGRTLAVHPGEWNVENPQFHYSWEWSQNGVNGWANAHYGDSVELSNYDIGNGPYLRAVIEVTRQGYAPATYYVPVGAVAKGDFAMLNAPKVTHTSSKFSVSTGTWNPLPYTVDRTWRVYSLDGSSTSSTAATIPTAGTAGKLVTVSLVPNEAGFNATSVMVLAQTGTLPKPTGTLSIGGTARVGQSLHVPALNWATNLNTLTYQWQFKSGSAWKKIAGATTDSYVVPASMLGKSLRSITTAKKEGYTTQSLISKPTPTVLIGYAPNPSFSSGEAAYLEGNVTTGSQVKIHPGVWSVPGAKYSYVWKWSKDGFSGFHKLTTTKDTVTIPSSIAGMVLSADITAKIPGHIPGTTTVKATVLEGQLVSSHAPSFTKTGTVYTAQAGTFSPAATTTSFSWLVEQPNGAFSQVSSSASFDVSSLAAQLPVHLMSEGSKNGYASGFSSRVLVRAGTLVPDAPLTVGAPTGTIFSFFAAPTPQWGPLGAKVAYQWQIKSGSTWTDLTSKKAIQNGARESSFIPAEGLYVNKDIRVKMTVSSKNYTTRVAYSTPSHVSILPAPTPDGAVSFDSTPRIGKIITVDPGMWSFDGGKYRYQWLESKNGQPSVPIAGATSASYLVPVSKHGYHLSVQVWLSHTGITTGTTIADPGPSVGDGTMSNTMAPKVTKAGSTLTVSNGVWSTAPSGFSYVWERVNVSGGSVVVGTGKSYTLVPADAGQYLRATVSATAAHYYDAEASVVAQKGMAPVPATPLQFLGSQVTPSALSVPEGSWPADTAVSYKWKRNGMVISGEGANNYFTKPGDLGKTITVTVTAKRLGYVDSTTTFTSQPIMAAANIAVVKRPTLDIDYAQYNARVDVVASLTPATWSVPGVTVSYQWLRGESEIAGATSAKYTLTAADRDEEISVQVVAKKKYYFDGVTTSGAWTIQPGGSDAYHTPDVTGSGKLGEQLTAPDDLDWVNESTFTYQWERLVAADTWIAVPGATSRTFTPTAAQGFASGKHVRVTLSVTRPGSDTSSWSLPEITLK